MERDNRGPICVVVADGDVLVRHAIAEYLRQCGYQAVEAAHSGEVVQILETMLQPVNAILSDASLPGPMNAFELRQWVRRANPDITTLLAGNVEAAARTAGELCDKGPHLKRPYEPQAVADRIKRLLASGAGKTL